MESRGRREGEGKEAEAERMSGPGNNFQNYFMGGCMRVCALCVLLSSPRPERARSRRSSHLGSIPPLGNSLHRLLFSRLTSGHEQCGCCLNLCSFLSLHIALSLAFVARHNPGRSAFRTSRAPHHPVHTCPHVHTSRHDLRSTRFSR